MNKTAIALFKNHTQAEPIRARLMQAGIPAEINDEPVLAKLWYVSKEEAGMCLVVSEYDRERSEQLLREWDAADGAMRNAIRCPECKSFHVLYPQFARNSMMTNVIMGVGAAVGFIEKDYFCHDCQFSWPKERAVPEKIRPNMAPNYFIEDVEPTNKG